MAEQPRFISARRRTAVIAALAATLLTIAPASAQDGDVDIDIDIVGSRADVTVVVPGDITIGPTAPGALPDWPYTCFWDNVFQETDVILGNAGIPIPGVRYWLRCEPNRPGIEPIGQFVLYDPADPIPGVDAISSLELAGMARAQLQPDPLAVGISPNDLQITGVESWLWPVGSTETIGETASTNGLAVTVQARWSHTVFDVDDDGVDPIVCDAQQAWEAGEDDPPCSHTYLTEGDRIVSAESHWTFVWWDNAAQPTPVLLETVQLVEVLDVPVVDLEAVITARRRAVFAQFRFAPAD